MKPNCYNRKPFVDGRWVRDGYWEDFDGRPTKFRVKWIPNRMSRECQQWGEYGEAKRWGWDCGGCRWKPEGA